MKNFYVFEESHETIIQNIKILKRPLYRKAVKEAETVLNIPPEHSVLSKI